MKEGAEAMKMPCLRLRSLIGTEHILHKQDFMIKEIPAYISDNVIMSHCRAFQRLYSSLCNCK
jgi:hypothetical protein